MRPQQYRFFSVDIGMRDVTKWCLEVLDSVFTFEKEHTIYALILPDMLISNATVILTSDMSNIDILYKSITQEPFNKTTHTGEN